MKRSSKKKISYGLTLLISAVCILGGFAYSSIVLATAGGGNELGGGCAPAGTVTPYWDTCYGATWRYYSVGQSSQTFVGGVASATPTVDGTENAPGGTISGCENVGGYYILGLEVYDPPSGSSYGYQRGIIKSSQLTMNGGSYNFRVVNGSEGWDTVAYKFALAEAAGATNGYTWDSNLGWFCYSPDFEYKDTEGSVWSNSSVHVDAQGDVSDTTVNSDNDGKVTLKISTNQDQVKVDFYHNISYTSGIANDGSNNDRYDNIPISWTTTWEEDASGRAGNGTFNTNGSMSNSGGEASRTNSQVISIGKGETVTYCQKIAYNPKNVKMRGKPVTDGEGRVLYYHYEITDTKGNGASESCIEITRPDIPGDGDDPEDPGAKFDISPSLGVFYAGENSTASWQAEVKGVPTRRYAGFQTVNYLIRADVPYSSSLVENNTDYHGSDVCSYYRQKFAYDCVNVDSGFRDTNGDTNNSGVTEKYSHPIGDYTQRGSVNIVVPDYVGDKYCSSMGYKFEYWVGVEKNGNTVWTPEPNKDYWAIYGAKCRTIAKKPSMAVWNGSLITNDGVGITAVSSPRHETSVSNHPGQIANDEASNSDIKKFGSWAEYLDVVGGVAKDFASGSSLAVGGAGACLRDIKNCSKLTISNNGAILGNSGIQLNSSYQTRLESFLKSKAKAGGDINADFRNATDTTIRTYSGTVNITENIVYDESRTYDSIYQLPQNIIFVDGNLNISSNVTRIDAWLIVNGTVNTCSEFTPQTPADADSSHQSTCTSQLAINGPVVANKILLNRSYGSDPIVQSTSSFGTNSTRASAAEVFNLRQDSYLWSYAQAGRYDSSYTESYSRELAPRY